MSINDESDNSLPKANDNENNALSKSNENEKDPLNSLEIIKIKETTKKRRYKWKNYIVTFSFTFFIIFLLSFFLIIMKYFRYSEEVDDKEQVNQNQNQKNVIPPINSKKGERENKIQNKAPKLKIGFLYPTITQFMISLGEYFAMSGNFEVFFLVKSSKINKIKYDNKIKRLNIYDNFKSIQKEVKEEKIDFLIVHYNITKININILKLLNTKIIGLYEEDINCEKEKTNKTYLDLKYLKAFNAFIHTNHDEYINYKQLGLFNNIYIPNINSLNQLNIKSPNINNHNIMLFGSLNDKKNNIISVITAMKTIVKSFNEAKLNILSSDSPSLETTKLINQFKLGKNVVISNICSFNYTYFSSSTLSIFTSLTEEYSPLINMAKSYGIPCIVSSDETNSSIFKNGVIKVDMSNYEQISKEIIKLFKDIRYKIMMMKKAKLSYDSLKKNMLSSWSKLIDAMENRKNEFQNVREEIENIFWNTDYQKSKISQLNNEKEKNNRTILKGQEISKKDKTIINKISSDKGDKLARNKTNESKSVKHKEIENKKNKEGKSIKKAETHKHISKKDKDKSSRNKDKHSISHKKHKENKMKKNKN